MWRNNMIGGIWENPYVLELGILDHCHEIHVLKDGERSSKALRTLPGVPDMSVPNRIAMENEMMDLFLMLEKWSQDKPGLRKMREEKFLEKAKETEV